MRHFREQSCSSYSARRKPDAIQLATKHPTPNSTIAKTNKNAPLSPGIADRYSIQYKRHGRFCVKDENECTDGHNTTEDAE